MNIKKFLFGIVLVVIGLIFSHTCFYYTINHPYIVNGVDGLMVSFIANNLLIPFIIFSIICLCGIIICWYEAYRK